MHGRSNAFRLKLNGIFSWSLPSSVTHCTSVERQRWGEYVRNVQTGMDAMIMYAFFDPCKALDFSGWHTATNLSMVSATSIITPIPEKATRPCEWTGIKAQQLWKWGLPHEVPKRKFALKLTQARVSQVELQIRVEKRLVDVCPWTPLVFVQDTVREWNCNCYCH